MACLSTLGIQSIGREKMRGWGGIGKFRMTGNSRPPAVLAQMHARENFPAANFAQKRWV
jgi:hypothetical protein